MRILDFKFNLTDHRKEFRRTNFSYYNSCIYEYEGILTIIIDNRVFFEVEIVILEFFRDSVSWINDSTKLESMLYNCIHVIPEDNPLVSFVYEKENWFIRSPWQLFDCTTTFSREELENAVLELRDDVEKQLAISIPLEVLPPSPFS